MIIIIIIITIANLSCWLKLCVDFWFETVYI